MSIDKIGAFTVLGKLGEGAHSSIMRIRRTEDGREYALKVVNLDTADDNKFLEQAKHEYRVGQMLSHPNLIKVHAFETEKNWFFQVKKAKLLVEFANGETLDRAKMPQRAKLLRVLEKVAAGLAHMHHRGVFHADLKPNNIMAGRGGLVKIIDYGLAWIKGEPKDRVQGTPEYMAPETASHKLINERTDIFNFGATMYRLVTFELPPSVVPELGVPMTEKMYKGLFRPVNELAPATPAPLCDLIHKCMAYNARKRPESIAEVQGILDRMADAEEAKLDPDELE
jgi:serine/threonine protein kinase